MQTIKVRQRPVNHRINWPETVHPLLQRIYSSRNIQHADDVELSLDKLLPPDGLKNIDAASDLLARFIIENKRILIVGDFDADGATSTALALRALTRMGARQVSYLVPNRFEFGYGLTTGIVKLALQQNPALIVTVDNGIANHEGVKLARENNVDVLITDHHLQGETLPDANVILNPNQRGCSFESKALAGVGVVFYLLIALRKKLREIGWFDNSGIKMPNLAEYLDIVALGTIADVVPLDRNNRVLVKEGLRRIRAGQCVKGITALLETAGRNPARITASDLGFTVGPRLNAAGRLDDMSIGIECLLADDDHAWSLAARLDHLNRERRDIENSMKFEALQSLQNLQLETQDIFGLAMYDSSWHQGVIGILASRLKEKINRPVIIFAPGDENQIKGSARSINAIHIRDVLEKISTQHPGLIIKFGGHAMAAGLTIAEKDFDRFKILFNNEIENLANEEILENVILTDGELNSDEYNLDTVSLLEKAGPWGQEFPEPVFTGSFRVISQRILKDRHYKLVLAPDADSDLLLDGIAFNYLEGNESSADTGLPQNINVVFKLSINDYRGRQSLQMMIDKIYSQQ